jgi:hypothetical protein
MVTPTGKNLPIASKHNIRRITIRKKSDFSERNFLTELVAKTIMMAS